MAIIQGNAKQGSTRGFYPKVINGSLRFNDDDGAYLSWTPASAGNRKTWTYSFWVKRGNLGTNQYFLDQTTGGSDSTYAHLHWYGSTDKIRLSGWTVAVTTDAVFRDPSAWYHVVFVVDTTEATDSDRVKIYVNGVQQSTSGTYYGLNNDTPINATSLHRIGGNGNLDGYLANVHFIDGQALTPSDFGETKNGVWVAKDYAGSFGTNGFYLTFEDDTQVEAFNTVLYRGNGGTQSITGTGFAPDLVWIKERNSTGWHRINDTLRGTSKQLYTNDTSAEDTAANNMLSFDSDGFTVGSDGSINGSGDTYVAWCWKAGDSNVSNTDGTITSTVRANDTYGFSIVSYTAPSSLQNITVGHGLSSVPSFVITKNRTDTGNSWRVWHQDLATNGYMSLESASAATTDATIYNGDPTSSVISYGTNGSVNTVNSNFIAYCWSEKTGYSKFGSYTGNGSTNAVTTGFKPSLVIIKRTNSAQNWVMFDSTRNVGTDEETPLYPNLSDAEGSAFDYIDFSDTGFTLKTANYNTSSDTFIYAAFADTREAAFWLDQSGNDNDWQPVNLDHNDTVADSPTNNFCTWNPLNKGTNLVTSDGNLSFNNSTTETTHRTCVATHGMTSGKYYWEVEVDSTTNVDMIGIVGQNATLNSGHVGTSGFGYGYSTANGNWYKASGWADDGTTPPAFPTGGTIGIAFDADNKKIYFHRNGTWVNNANPTAGTGANGTYTGSETVFFPAGSRYYNTGKWVANFGQQPFKYDPPA